MVAALQCERMITEESLRGLFSRYGEVQDVMVKKSTFSKVRAAVVVAAMSLTA